MQREPSELEQLCQERGVKISTKYGEAKGTGWEGAAHNWRVTLKYQGRQLTTDFFGGSAVRTLSAADVLYSLCMDAAIGEQDFEEFCGDFGYDIDSRSALKTWEACVSMSSRVRRLLGDDLELFQEAEH